MKRALVCIALCLFTSAIPCICLAEDTDMYNTANVKPNVLIIFDNSGSMDTDVPYSDSEEYCSGAGCPYETDTIYQRECERRGRHGQCTRWGGWEVYIGTFTDNNNDGIHDSDTNIRRGNRLNYDTGDYGTRLAVAKLAVKDIITASKNYVRFGVMVLNGAIDINDGFGNYYNYQTDTSVLSTAKGGAQIIDRTDAEIEGLIDDIEGMVADGGTPLANRLINAAQYFRGDFGSYNSPLDETNWCRKNYVILMTDGKPEGEGDYRNFGHGTRWANNDGEYQHIEEFLDDNPESRDVDNDNNDPDPTNDYDNGGSDYLDDVAFYLHNTEDSLDPDHAIEGDQNLTIYTIGFKVNHQLLQDTADNGGGTYETTDDYQQLLFALETIMSSIKEKTNTFTAPVVPVQRSTSGDKMYISLFTPKSNSNFWPGYLIKLHIGTDGKLYASDETTAATDDDDVLYKELWDPTKPPYPYWEVHAVMKGMNLESRNIYTYLGNSDLNDTSNAFRTTNTAIDDTMLDNPTKSPNAAPAPTAREDLMRYIRGYDSYDDNVDDVYDEKREYILGDILHSRSLIVDYVIDDQHPVNNERVIYVGTNDGMLHAFDDSDGSEKWAFIPPDLLPKLKDIVEEDGHQYYVDGSPIAYIKDVDNDENIEESDGDQVIIIFGERRGGTSYTALDVTDPDDPQFLWRIDNIDNSSTFGIPAPNLVITEMGQSWSEPEIGKVKDGATPKTVAIIGGGYWPDEQSKGNALYIIDITDGSLVTSFTSSDHANMTYSIPSAPLAVDTTFDNYINRVYVGDLGGQMWRFGCQRENAADTDTEDGDVSNWTPRRLFQAESGTKIFYAPDLVLEPGYAYLYFGTGDRTDPMKILSEGAVVDRFYAVKDKNENDDAFQTRVGGFLTESHLVDVTDNILSDPSATEEEKEIIRTQLATMDGWFIRLTNDGEKALAAPIVIDGLLFFTTFSPVCDPCSFGGDGRLYVLNYLTAEAMWDLDEDGDIDQDDTSLVIGSGIPTEAVVTIGKNGERMLYVAVGDKIFMPDGFSGGGPPFTIKSWREVY